MFSLMLSHVLSLPIHASLAGNSPCLVNEVCTDGIGSFTCECAPGFCGPTCAGPPDPSQNAGQCCEDNPTWVDARYGYTCSELPTATLHWSRSHFESYCSQSADAAGVTAADACPVACQSGCALTFDDCCELSHQPNSDTTCTCTCTISRHYHSNTFVVHVCFGVRSQGTIHA